MTEKQEERIKIKIKKIKAALAADKKFWGGNYHDGQGLRYVPPGLYIQLGDFTGGLRYLNWFHKNFPDDAGYPQFLFEWTIILFKTGRLLQSEKKAFETYCSNIYLLDQFLGRPLKPIDLWEGSNLETKEYTQQHFNYSHQQDQQQDVANWLTVLLDSEKFTRLSGEYTDIKKQLAREENSEARGRLIARVRKLVESFDKK